MIPTQKLRPLGKLESISAICHHLGFFNNAAVSADYGTSQPSYVIPTSDLEQIIYRAVASVIHTHPILSAIPVDEDTPSPYFARLQSINLKRSISFVNRTKPYAPILGSEDSYEDEELDELLEKQHNIDFKQDYGSQPFWRLVILQNPGIESKLPTGQNQGRNKEDLRTKSTEFTACFVFHHALCDGLSGLTFHNSLQDALNVTFAEVEASPGYIITSSDNSLLPPIEELHPLPISPEQHTAASTRAWTGGYIRAPCHTRFRSLAIPPSVSNSFMQACKENNVTVTSALGSLIATILYKLLPVTPESLNCNIPVNLRKWLPQNVVNGSMGNWFDAFQVRFFFDQNSNISTHIWPQAQVASSAIASYLNASSSGPYTNIGLFKDIPDLSVLFKSLLGKERDSAIELSNVGVFSNSADQENTWQVERVILSRSAVVSGSAITVTAACGGDGSMTLGFTWQEGVVERKLVNLLITEVGRYFRE